MTDQFTQIINHYVALVRLKLLDDSLIFIEKAAQKIIDDLNLKVVKKVSHPFYPKGITLVYILSESHLLIHTWPEYNTVHIDLVTCSYRGMNEFKNAIKSAFSEKNINSVSFKSVDVENL